MGLRANIAFTGWWPTDLTIILSHCLLQFQKLHSFDCSDVETVSQYFRQAAASYLPVCIITADLWKKPTARRWSLAMVWSKTWISQRGKASSGCKQTDLSVTNKLPSFFSSQSIQRCDILTHGQLKIGDWVMIPEWKDSCCWFLGCFLNLLLADPWSVF